MAWVQGCLSLIKSRSGGKVRLHFEIF